MCCISVALEPMLPMVPPWVISIQPGSVKPVFTHFILTSPVFAMPVWSTSIGSCEVMVGSAPGSPSMSSINVCH